MPDPKRYKDKDSWMNACMSKRKDENPDEDNDQSVAICLNMWQDKSKEKKSSSGYKTVEAKELSTKGRKQVSEHNFAAPSSSDKVTDNKDHFPIHDKSHAENARSRVMQYSKPPAWWSGSLKELQDHVFRSTAKRFDFDMDEESQLPSERTASSEQSGKFIRKASKQGSSAPNNYRDFFRPSGLLDYNIHNKD